VGLPCRHHYAQNALAALCVSDVFDVPFRSMARRWLHLPAWTDAFRAWGSWRDSGGRRLRPPPTEIAATLAAARLFGRRLLVAFQPHRSRARRDLLRTSRPRSRALTRLYLLTSTRPASRPSKSTTIERCWPRFPGGQRRDLPARKGLAEGYCPAYAPAISCDPGRGRPHPGGRRDPRTSGKSVGRDEIMTAVPRFGCLRAHAVVFALVSA